MLSSSWLAWDAAGSRSADTNVSPGQSNFKSTLDTSNCQYDPAATTKRVSAAIHFRLLHRGLRSSHHEAEPDHQRSRTQPAGELDVRCVGGQGLPPGLASSAIEIGGKFRRAHKYDDSYSDRLDPLVSIPMTQFPSQFSNSNFYEGAYPLGPAPIYEDAAGIRQRQPRRFQGQDRRGSIPETTISSRRSLPATS